MADKGGKKGGAGTDVRDGASTPSLIKKGSSVPAKPKPKPTSK
jgi:hypothetical protein